MVRCRPLSARTRASRERGFTLVELLVAMAAGLTVSMAAFLLSKNATRFFQNEARASASHLAATLGLNRIVADLQRAAHQSSPNVQRDPFLCGDIDTWPEGLKRLAGVTIVQDGSMGGSGVDQLTANGLSPDALIIGGSFNTTEQFYFNSINCTAGGCVVNIDPFSGAVQRTLARANGGGASLNDIFRPNRFLRLKILGQSKYMYGVIQGTTVAGDPVNTIQVTLMATYGLPQLQAFGDCGVTTGFNGTGGFANPVSRVRYDIRSLIGHASYGALVGPAYPGDPAAAADVERMTGDSGRTELVRVELDENGGEIPATLELVAEYAVDLKFGIVTAEESGLPGVTNPQLTRYPITATNNAAVYDRAGDNTTAGAVPERIRAVQVRLSTRTRAPDRDVNLPFDADDPAGPVTGPDGRRYRFLIPGVVDGVSTLDNTPPAGSPPVYARMRTLYADVALPNQAYVPW
ncbi:prepilin-type N-terminal cleavage/methylation domain-containing protein [Sorangium sp. So ce1036]|uniref:PilW family protein n=1 Tax=Sorangium sp. So ce1036 TaxID=3133328 RepID=UPI003F0F5379